MMAIRLIFETDGNEIRLLRKKHVDMEAPAAPAETPRRGIVAEMRDAEDRPLFQQSIATDMDMSAEVFEPEGMRREEVPQLTKTFMLVLPDDDAAASLVFVDAGEPSESGFRITAQSTEPREIARFSLSGDES